MKAKTKNLHKKLCTKTMSPNQLNIKLFTKAKKSPLAISEGNNICKSNDAHYCDTMKSKVKPTKKGQICKNHDNWLMKTGCSKKKEHLRKKTVMKCKLYFNR